MFKLFLILTLSTLILSKEIHYHYHFSNKDHKSITHRCDIKKGDHDCYQIFNSLKYYCKDYWLQNHCAVKNWGKGHKCSKSVECGSGNCKGINCRDVDDFRSGYKTICDRHECA